MKKRMNKKGQELSIGTLILILVGVAILVMLILGFTLGFGFILDIFKLGPGQQLEKVRQSCIIAGEGDLRLDYCKTFKEVEVAGQDMVVNCEYPDIVGTLESGQRLECADNEEALYCQKIKDLSLEDFDEDLLVNGKSCAGWGVSEKVKCTDLGGIWKDSVTGCDATTEEDKTVDVTDSADNAANQNKLCCVPL